MSSSMTGLLTTKPIARSTDEALLRIPILMYHEVAASARVRQIAQKTQRSFIVTVEQFAAQMQWLVNNGFTAISLSELMQFLAGTRALRSNEKPVVITFDDGFTGNYLHALPILSRLNLAATFFVIVNRIGRPYYLSWLQLGMMVESGMHVESHTMTHALLGQARLSSLIYELQESKRALEKKLQTPVCFLSLPHGSCPRDLKKVASDCGYWGVCTSEPACAEADSEPYALPRLAVDSRYDLPTFARLVQANPELINRNAAARRTKRAIKKMFGEKNYNRAYHLIYGVKET